MVKKSWEEEVVDAMLTASESMAYVIDLVNEQLEKMKTTPTNDNFVNPYLEQKRGSEERQEEFEKSSKKDKV